MPLHYKSPPLVEALCELRFESDPQTKWDWTVPGRLYSKIENRFPKRRQRLDLAVSSGPNDARTLVQFVSENESTMVQVGPDVLAVNSLGPHIGWPELKNTLATVLHEYRGIAAPSALISAAVRYINRVEIPIRPGFALERYFEVLPGLPKAVPMDVSTFLIHTEVVCDEPSALLRFRFGSTNSVADIAAFIVDYEHAAPKPMVPSFEALETWLDAGHERIELAFYGTFTPMTHSEIFQEVQS